MSQHSHPDDFRHSSSTPQPADSNTTPFLAPPDLPFLSNDPASIASTPRGSAAYPDDSQNASSSNANLNLNQSPLLADTSKEESGLGAASAPTGRGVNAKKPLFKRPIFWFLAAAAAIVVILAVVLPVVFVVVKPNRRNSSSASGASTNGNGEGSGNGNGNGNTGGGKNNLVSGADGSTITKEDGSTFTYNNKFGGFCEYTFTLPSLPCRSVSLLFVFVLSSITLVYLCSVLASNMEHGGQISSHCPSAPYHLSNILLCAPWVSPVP